NGIVDFFGQRYVFAVLRVNVLRTWPPQLPSSLGSSPKKRASPIADGVQDAITALWPKGIPSGLKAKDRNNEIADWLKSNGRSVPSGNGLARAVQRAMRAMKPNA